jgi:hypothetical protein
LPCSGTFPTVSGKQRAKAYLYIKKFHEWVFGLDSKDAMEIYAKEAVKVMLFFSFRLEKINIKKLTHNRP